MDDFEEMYSDSEPELTFDKLFEKVKLSVMNMNRVECIAYSNNLSPLKINNALIQFNDFIEFLTYDDLEFILIHCDDYELILNVYVDEYKYIHIEFRGLATVKDFLNICAIREYLEAINDMYAEVIKVCQADLSTIATQDIISYSSNQKKYLKYKFKYLKLKNNIMNYNE